MTNLENIINKGMVTDNWFIDGTGAEAVNIVIALRDKDAKAYKEQENWLLDDYKGPIKLKQWEYDLIDHFSMPGYMFEESFLNDLKTEKGYFTGVYNTSMLMEDILKNCLIIADDYDDFDESK